MPEKLAYRRTAGFTLLEAQEREIAMIVSMSHLVVTISILTYAVWNRPNFWRSPAISRSLDAGLYASGLSKEDVDIYDFYS